MCIYLGHLKRYFGVVSLHDLNLLRSQTFECILSNLSLKIVFIVSMIIQSNCEGIMYLTLLSIKYKLSLIKIVQLKV